MAGVIEDDAKRVYPMKKPAGWTPKLPRWTLRLPEEVNELAVVYIGVQGHDESTSLDIPIAAVEKFVTTPTTTTTTINSNGQINATNDTDTDLKNKQLPIIVDRFQVISGRDNPGSAVWACYFTHTNDATSFTNSLRLSSLHASMNDSTSRAKTGLWFESYTPSLSRFETNYSGPDYQPGLAQLRGTQQLPHELTGYWGAARDRIPSSAYDKFDDDTTNNKENVVSGQDTTGQVPTLKPNFTVPSVGARVRGSNQRTIAHIRSGQFWENSNEVERKAYENDLERHLRNGLDDIYSRPEELGDFGLRFLRNVLTFDTVHAPSTSTSAHARTGDSTDDQIKTEVKTEVEVKVDGERRPRRETCAAGFFRSLTDLEAWAKGCPSHHRIYGGSIAHRTRFGAEAKMRTWHEICVLKPGEARWEYVNCVPGTGTIAFQTSEVDTLE